MFLLCCFARTQRRRDAFLRTPEMAKAVKEIILPVTPDIQNYH